MANIIFDFDGTIADTFPLVAETSYQIAGSVARLPHAKLEALRSLPLLSAVQKLNIPVWWRLHLAVLTRKRMHAHMHEVPPFSGVPELIAGLHTSGHRLYILSSNYVANVEAFLHTHGLNKYFTDIEGVSYGSVWHKKRGLKRLLKRNGLPAEGGYYVGNEVLDVLAAAQVGLRTIAVSWSGYDRGALAATQPFAVVDTPAELAAVFAQQGK